MFTYIFNLKLSCAWVLLLQPDRALLWVVVRAVYKYSSSRLPTGNPVELYFPFPLKLGRAVWFVLANEIWIEITCVISWRKHWITRARSCHHLLPLREWKHERKRNLPQPGSMSDRGEHSPCWPVLEKCSISKKQIWPSTEMWGLCIVATYPCRSRPLCSLRTGTVPLIFLSMVPSSKLTRIKTLYLNFYVGFFLIHSVQFQILLSDLFLLCHC